MSRIKAGLVAVGIGALCVCGAASARLNAQQDVDSRAAADTRRDPCEQRLRPPGHANGLHRRCDDAGGSGGVARGDFNADGFADLAIGVPFEDQDGVNAVGGVHIFYGSTTGLSSTADLFLDETNFGFSYGSDDHFGWALASGDFNGDTFSDLAIGMPGRGTSALADEGRVLLVDGGRGGLVVATARVFSLLSDGVGNAGESLVWADFNGDGFGDLAVGIPDGPVLVKRPPFCIAEGVRAGAVQVFFGGTNGLTQLGAQRLFERAQTALCGSNGGFGTPPVSGDRFGSVLAAGNFNGDSSNGRPIFDLVIGNPLNRVDDEMEEITGFVVFGLRAGQIYILPGSTGGLDRSKVQLLSQDTAGIGGVAELNDQFGHSLAVGDFNADLRSDLAIGVPFEDLTDNTEADAGAVHVVFGSFVAGELVTSEASLFITQTDLPGASVEAGDRLGWSLAAGRFDSDFVFDLAIGAPGEDINSVVDAGIVHVLHGDTFGPVASTAQLWRQGAGGLGDVAEGGDQFGYALSAWNYGRDGTTDLAIGVPFEDLVSSTGTALADAGAVVVIYGTAAGLSANAGNRAQFWHQNINGVDDVAQIGDRFGHALY